MRTRTIPRDEFTQKGNRFRSLVSLALLTLAIPLAPTVAAHPIARDMGATVNAVAQGDYFGDFSFWIEKRYEPASSTEHGLDNITRINPEPPKSQERLYIHSK